MYHFTFTGYYGKICQKFGGKWASVDSKCITHSCFKHKKCGYWAFPSDRCNRLKIDDSISEVYFQLGDPDRISGTWYFWDARKGDNAVLARIEHESLKSLICESPPIIHKKIEADKINLNLSNNN